MEGGDVLLLDGTCGLCTRSQRFLEPRLSTSGSPHFITKRSPEGESLLDSIPDSMATADSMVLIRAGKPYIFSGAAIRCTLYMHWYWRLTFLFLWLVPSPIRDVMYRVVARNRRRFFKLK